VSLSTTTALTLTHCLSRCYRYYFLSVTLLLSSAASAVVFFIPKSGVASQSCQPIATYYYSICTNHVVSTRVSTASFAVVLCFGRNTSKHAHVRFSDYKLLIHATNDNPFLLCYIIIILTFRTFQCLICVVNQFV
jgi:hypothetical protein